MDAIIILGAAVWPDGPSPTLKRRTLHAAELWHRGDAPAIIACGGLGQHPPSESEMMRRILLDADVPDTAITLENQSTSTLENIRYAKDLLTGRDVIIVTDSYHARRARMVARHFGLRAVADCPAVHRHPVRHRIRETCAIPVYAMRLWARRRKA